MEMTNSTELMERSISVSIANLNVKKWVSGYYGTYSDSPVPDPNGALTGLGKKLRGGSCVTNSATTRVSYRVWCGAVGVYFHAGFRVCRVKI
jgi:formylglycine-generating enzyme required for sulfatase activity